MDVEKFSEWFEPLSLELRIRALSFIYSDLTISSRALFMPEYTTGKDKRVLEILHGLNEIHHTLSNCLGSYSRNDIPGRSVQYLSQQLSQIESHYRLERFVTPALEGAQAAIAK